MITLRFMLGLQVLLSNLSTYVVAPAPRNLEHELTWASSERTSDPRSLSSHIVRRGNSGSNLRNTGGSPSAYGAIDGKPECFHPEPRSVMRRTRPRECEDAISMFDVGYVAVSHDVALLGEPATASPSHPAKFNLWLSGRPGPNHPERYDLPTRKYVLPAAFRSGRCLVFVGPGDRHGFPKNGKEGPVNAAIHLWWEFWGEAVNTAKELVKMCIGPGWTVGTIVLSTQLGKYPFRYRVTVSGVPRRSGGDPSYMPDPFPDEGWRIYVEEADEYWYTLYNINGTWSGPGTKGLWRADTGIVRAKAP